MTEQRTKQVNYRYVKETLNDYERLVLVALNDWHSPQLRNVMQYKDKVEPNGCVNDMGTTFLHYAVAKQDSRNDNGSGPVEILIQAGADIFAKDSDGLTPYQYAKLKGHSVNQSILRKEYNFLAERYEQHKARQAKIERQDIVVEGTDGVEAAREAKKPIMSQMEYATLLDRIENFERQKPIWDQSL